MGASCKTVAIDAAGSRTVQFNAWRKHLNVWWFDDNDGKRQSEQNDGDRNLCDDWIDKTENWVKHEMM